MNNEIESGKNLIRSSLVPLLGVGLCIPLFAGARPQIDALLGVFGVASLVLITALGSAFASRVPRNFRISLGLLMAGGIFSCASIVAAALRLPGQLPVATLAPLLVITAVLAADNPAYEAKRSTALAIVDGGLVGLGFLAGIMLLGAARDLAMKLVAGPTGYGNIPLALILITIVVFIVETIKKLKRGAA